jgi:chromatin remodeling complex protein RSC6
LGGQQPLGVTDVFEPRRHLHGFPRDAVLPPFEAAIALRRLRTSSNPIENPMAAPKKPAKKANPALMKPVQPDAVLAAVVGSEPMPRSEITKRLWAYIKKNGLQDPKVKTNIRADDKLKAVFGGKAVVNMFEMTRLVSLHMKS